MQAKDSHEISRLKCFMKNKTNHKKYLFGGWVKAQNFYKSCMLEIYILKKLLHAFKILTISSLTLSMLGIILCLLNFFKINFFIMHPVRPLFRLGSCPDCSKLFLGSSQIIGLSWTRSVDSEVFCHLRNNLRLFLEDRSWCR